MRFPFGAPSVSDAAKLQLRPNWTPVRSTVGVRVYELMHQLLRSDDFATLDAWTQVDLGAGTISLADGVVTIQGSGTGNQTGIYRTSPETRAEGIWQWDFQACGPSNSIVEYAGPAASAALTMAPWAWVRAVSNGRYYCLVGSGVTTVGGIGKQLTTGAWYTARMSVQKDEDGNFYRVRLTITGGTEYPVETQIIDALTVYTAPGANMYFEFARTTNTTPASTYRLWRWHSGFATDGPTLTYVADAGENKTFDGWVFANLAAVGSWATTNAKFKYSFDDGTPSYNASWLSLAELNGTAALTTRKRYARLMVQVNSDGATQQYAGEINADDATAGGGDYPEVGNVLVTDTVQAAAGTYAALPAVVDKFNPS